MADEPRNSLQDLLAHRFGDPPARFGPAENDGLLAGLAGRRSCRDYSGMPVDPALIETLSAAALSAPTKSDLQQRDIVIIGDPSLRADIDALFPNAPWIAAAPAFLVFLANNRRQRLIHQWRDIPFANDHLDAFFNATVDAAIVLATFVIAAERMGLGCCPISAIRNQPDRVRGLLGLPDHVFPVAGLTLGWPKTEPNAEAVSPRLPLSVTVHKDRYQEAGLEDGIAAYDARRARQTGTREPHAWSAAKVHQYSKPQHADFGAFIRAIGFRLD